MDGFNFQAIIRVYGNECEKKPNVMRILRQLFPAQIVMDTRQKGDVFYFNYWSSVIRNGTKSTRQITSRIDMTTTALNKKKTLAANLT